MENVDHLVRARAAQDLPFNLSSFSFTKKGMRKKVLLSTPETSGRLSTSVQRSDFWDHLGS